MKHFLSILILVATVSAHADRVPEDLVLTRFAGPDLVPSPACLCASESGAVFVGVDLNGSLGKGPGRGRIVKLLDEDKDGVADAHSEFAAIDNPRGLIAVGEKLYVLHTAYGEDNQSTGMDLVVLTDSNQDGVADGPAKTLIKGICSATAINNRGTDHSTNGIQLGIDGWIYIAVGDFGFADAVGADGRKLTLLGGGIVRVRPDGTEMELYTTGMRNIYDVAIDPFLNVFTRGNTNDGGGWNVRFTHHIQSGEYGYPRLFLNFSDEIIPALEDVGGGSGVGALFLDEPTWPEHYNRQPLMADWGRKAVYLHRLSADGASFTQKQEDFVQISQVSDLDVDPSGQLFLSAWDGAGFKGDETKGYVVRLVPKDWSHRPAPDFAKASEEGLVGLLGSESAKVRLHAQQELLSRKVSDPVRERLREQIRNQELPLQGRVASLFTLAQAGEAPAELMEFHSDASLREFAMRAATDRLPRIKEKAIDLEPFLASLNSGGSRERVSAAIALGRLGSKDAAEALLSVAYQKPEPEGKISSTQLDTIKGNRKATHKLAVDPGEMVYLSLAETNPVSEASQIALLDAAFALADGSSIPLKDLTPISGSFFVGKNPDGSGPSNKLKESGVQLVTAQAPGVIALKAPDNAISFSTKVQQTKTNPKGGSVDFFVTTVSPDSKNAGRKTSPRHSTPNEAVILPHIAMQSLVRLEAVEACLEAMNTSSEDLALWALSYLHSEKAVEGLLDELAMEKEAPRRERIMTVLGRLYQKEAPYDGSWWWSTRPDTRGPYYKPETWDLSPKIAAVLMREWEQGDEANATFLAGLNDRMRMGIDTLGTLVKEKEVEEMPTVDLAKIRAKKGAVGSTPIEDVLLSLDKIKGDPKQGETLFTQQGCIACHALKNGGPALGPYMGQIGSIMNREQIAVAILRPNDTISQGFQTAEIHLKEGGLKVGFVTESDSETLTLRDMAGQVTKIQVKNVKEEKHLPTSMMPPGLANALSLEEFASLVSFLASKKG